MQEKSTPYITLIFKAYQNLHRFWQTSIFVFLMVFLPVKFASAEIIAVLDAVFGTMTLQQKKKEYAELIHYVDSIKKIKEIQQTDKALRGKFEIQQRFIQYKKETPQLLSVSLVALHNGGKALRVDENWELDVNESSSPELEADFNEDKDDIAPLWDGLLYWSNEVKSEGIVFFEDIKNYPLFYYGKLKPYLNSRGVKAVHSIYIGNDGKNLYYISFDYQTTDVDEEKSAKDIREMKRFVKQRMTI